MQDERNGEITEAPVVVAQLAVATDADWIAGLVAEYEVNGDSVHH